MPMSPRLLRTALAAVILWLQTASAAVSSQQLNDQQMKAAYVLNFVRYTDWPEHSLAAPDSPLTVCVFGDSSAVALAGIAGKSIKGHPVKVRGATTSDDARSCHVLFVPELDARRFISTLRTLQNTPVLTVGEAEGFVDIGGMIGLVHLDNRLQFEVNLGVIQQAQLKVSSQLLRLARNVIESRPR